MRSFFRWKAVASVSLGSVPMALGVSQVLSERVASAQTNELCESGQASSQPQAREVSDVTASAPGQPIEATQVTQLADGGHSYVWSIGGATVSTNVPPAGFQPSSASAAELSEYGFPPRPTSTAALTLWNAEFDHYQSITPQLWAKQQPEPTQTGGQPAATSTLYSGNWSGYKAAPPANTGFTEVQGNFKQSAAGSTSCSNSQESQWVGIGGWNTGSLIQDGTSIVPGRSPEDFAWYEWLSSTGGQSVTEQVFDNLPVNTNDPVFQETNANLATNIVTFTMDVSDNGTDYMQYYNLSNAIDYYDGSSAEWINERPCQSMCSSSTPVLYPLTNYESTDWKSLATASGADGVVSGLSGLDYNPIEMKNGNDVLSTPGAYSSSTNSFTDTWKACS